MKLLEAGRAGQAAARRPHRRGQVRRDVPRAGAAHAGHPAGGDRRPGAGECEGRTWSGSAGAPAAIAATSISEDWQKLVSNPEIDIVIEATGNPVAAVEHILGAFRHGKHVVNVTVEADAFCGPMLAQKAKEAGVVYSLAYGDQPAIICDLVDWARAAGFPVVAAGRGHKWLPHFAQSTPETVWGYYGLTPEQAKLGGLNPKMFNSFLDGSKPAIETSAVCNATGLTPAPDGLAFPALFRRQIPKR